MSRQLGMSRPVLMAAPLAAVAPDAGVIVANWTGNEPRDVEVSLEQFGANTTYIPDLQSMILCGLYNPLGGTNEPNDAGFFKLQYGVGAVQRTRYVDLMPARVFLGFCDNVTVSACRWRSTRWPVYSGTDVIASASVGEARGGAYDELVSTQVYYLPAATNATRDFFSPTGANGWSAAVNGWDAGTEDPVPIWGSAEPDFWFSAFGEDLYISPANNTRVPSTRRLLNSDIVKMTMSAATVNPVQAWVQWYLNS